MKYPTEFTHRIYRTRLGFLNNNAKTLSEITKDYPDTEIDVIYENLKSVIVLVFKTPEDCLAFTLKNGKEYV